MNADDLVEFLLQDDDLTVEVRYEGLEFPFRPVEITKESRTSTRKVRNHPKPQVAQVDEILRDLEKLIVRPSKSQAYTSLESDDRDDTDHELTALVGKDGRHKQKSQEICGKKPKKSSKTKNGPEIRSEERVPQERTEAKLDTVADTDSKKSHRKNSKKKHNKTHMEIAKKLELPQDTRESSRKKKPKSSFPAGQSKTVKGSEELYSKPEAQSSKKSSKKAKSRKVTAADPRFSSDEQLVEEIKEFLDLERPKYVGDQTKIKKGKKKSKKTTLKHQELPEIPTGYVSHNLPRKTRGKSNVKKRLDSNSTNETQLGSVAKPHKSTSADSVNKVLDTA